MKARDAELRVRVERLLRGDIRPDDLTRLFLGLRERTFGAAWFRELGDFAAHSDERVKGAVTDEVRIFLLGLRFNLQYIEKSADLADLPADSPQIARGTLARLDAATLKEIGLKRKAATVVLDKVLSRLSRKPDGRLSLKGIMTEEEFSVLKVSLSSIIVKPAFTDDNLWKDFCFVLGKNNLLTDAEKSALKGVKPALTLHAIALMHHVEMVIADGWKASLRADDDQGLLGVASSAWFDRGERGPVSIGTLMFKTSLKAEEWCDPSLLATPTTLRQALIEVSPAMRLVPMA